MTCNQGLREVRRPVCLVKFSASSSAFQAISVGFTIFGAIFVYIQPFNPTIEVVTFRLHGCKVFI